MFFSSVLNNPNIFFIRPCINNSISYLYYFLLSHYREIEISSRIIYRTQHQGLRWKVTCDISKTNQPKKKQKKTDQLPAIKTYHFPRFMSCPGFSSSLHLLVSYFPCILFLVFYFISPNYFFSSSKFLSVLFLLLFF